MSAKEISMAELGEALEVEDVSARHRRERKELQAKIQALKKNAPKNDKKKRKEVMEEVAKMENEMEQRHAEELKLTEQQQQQQATTTAAVEKAQPLQLKQLNGEKNENELQTPRISKAQKRRDKKEQEARQRAEDLRAAEAAAELEAHDTPKAVELRKLQEKLKARKLAIFAINSDGDCLYNSIRHQLTQKHMPSRSVQELRNMTADYIVANKDTLINYMTDPRTWELLTDEEFDKYCNDVRNTAAWGGHIELKALSAMLQMPIEVLQADGTPTVLGAQDYKDVPPLTITYHRHLYRLGEHYNSTLPISDVATSDFDDEFAN